jgi:hypothetical protein
VGRKKASDRVESALRRADATLETWFRRARKRGAGVLRQRVDGLQAGLTKLSARLGHLERDREVAPVKRTRAVIARKSPSPRKPKKAE